ncbi:hypothetical protein C8R44DRAFT_867348 [Mycena epipterygia]|nr:hypothetical protein C8R44DRAFT_867348 [Mycena epipterygia]
MALNLCPCPHLSSGLSRSSALPPKTWKHCWCPAPSAVENIRFSEVKWATVGTLSDIFAQCRLAWRVVLHSTSWYPQDDRYVFTVPPHRPLAPALRELEFQVGEWELERIFRIGFSDVVLDTVTGCICNVDDLRHVELLAGAHPASADLHKTVREIRISAAFWNNYVDVFESYPPQSPDGIVLAIEEWNDPSDQLRPMRISGLTVVKFCGHFDSSAKLQELQNILALIEPLAAHEVEVCVGNSVLELQWGNTKQDYLSAFQTALGDRWAACGHCM